MPLILSNGVRTHTVTDKLAALFFTIFQMPFLLALGEYYQSGEGMCQGIVTKKALESNIKGRVVLKKEVLTALFFMETKVIMSKFILGI